MSVTRHRFTVGTAILHIGPAQVDEIGGALPITLDGARGGGLVASLRATTVVPVHYASWAHLSRGREDVAAFERAGIEHTCTGSPPVCPPNRLPPPATSKRMVNPIAWYRSIKRMNYPNI